MKEEISSFDIAALVPELNKTLENARIENIYQIGRLTFLIRLHKPNQPPLQLLIEAGKRLHLTSYLLEKPKKPPTFCMALRKYLRNSIISGIKQHKFERIVIIIVKSRNGEFSLVCEFFSQGNIILVSPEKKILQALTYRKMRDRNILRGEVFHHAPTLRQDPTAISLEGFDQIKSFGQLEIVKALTRLLGIGGLYSEEILIRTKIEKKTACEALTNLQIRELFDQLQQILLLVNSGKLEPSVIIDENGDSIDAVPITLMKYADLTKIHHVTFNEALDEYYIKTSVEKRNEKKSENFDRILAKENRILKSQEKNFEELKLKLEKNQKIGNAIFSHLGGLQIFLQRILEEKKSGMSWKQIVSKIEAEETEGKVPKIHFDSLDGKKIKVSIEEQTFSLNIQHSAQFNGAEYYAKAKKAQGKIKGIKNAIQETHNRIKQLQEQSIQVEEKTNVLPKKTPKKIWYEKFRWFYSSENSLVIGGRDATTNEILIKKHMEDQDVVFHADIVGAPFVLIKVQNNNPSEQTLFEAAQIAAAYSQAWKIPLESVDVYWFYPQQITKTPPSGQYLRRGSFMIHGSKHYIRNVPLRIAVGLIAKEEQIKIVGGPIEAISKNANAYVKIKPGKKSSEKLARQIREQLAEHLPKSLRKDVLAIPLNEIQSFIPSGKGEIFN